MKIVRIDFRGDTLYCSNFKQLGGRPTVPSINPHIVNSPLHLLMLLICIIYILQLKQIIVFLKPLKNNNYRYLIYITIKDKDVNYLN